METNNKAKNNNVQDWLQERMKQKEQLKAGKVTPEAPKPTRAPPKKLQNENRQACD